MKVGDPVDAILAGGHLPARVYDEIFERVLAATESRPQSTPWWRRPWMLVPAGTLATVLGVWLMLYRPQGAGFAVKGGNQSAVGPGIAVACGSFAGPRCRTGDTIMFVVNPSVPGGYLVAYAERIDEPDGERIWYFPDAAGRSPLVTAGESTAVLEEGVKVGPEHRPGRYRITLWLTPTPIQRKAPALASRSSEGATTTLEIEILP